MAAKIRRNDEVIVLAGKDKGKEGKIISVLKREDKVIVENLNMIKKHVKPNGQNESGGIVDKEAPIHVSNVKVITEKKVKKAAKKTAKESTK